MVANDVLGSAEQGVGHPNGWVKKEGLTVSGDAPLVPVTGEAKLKVSLEPRNSREAWTTQLDPCTSHTHTQPGAGGLCP
jgi:hypothetical protein